MATDPNFGLSDKEFKRLQQGDEGLQLKILKKNSKDFLKTAKDTWKVSVEVAEEIVSGAFATLFMDIESGKCEKLNLRGYVYGGMRYAWQDLLDKQKRTIQITTNIFPNLAVAVEKDNPLMERLNWAFNKLCGKCQKLLGDHYWEGKTYGEIGEELGIKEDTARQRGHECIKKMRTTLGVTGKETKNYDFSSN
jgi:RNA polymerase sigma factor (sigma-70 family)